MRSNMADLVPKNVIPNWGIYTPVQVQIHLDPFEDDLGNMSYNAVLFVMLASEDNSDYNVSLVTDLIHEDPKQCAKITFIYASTLFMDISPKVVVFPFKDEEQYVIDLRAEKMLADDQTIH